MKNYWSISKFADWVRGTVKPDAMPIGNWGQWKKQARDAHPFRFWLVEEALDKLQDIVYWPYEKFNSIRYYINNRWVTKTHALVADPTQLKPGQWADLSSRFLPCMFGALVDYVEIEKAWNHCAWDDEAYAKYCPPWYRTSWVKHRSWRCPEAGVEHLEWEAGLKKGTDFNLPINDPTFNEPTLQAQGAREVLELYRWYKEVYLKRPDPHDSSGWAEYCRICDEQGVGVMSGRRQSKELKEMSDRCHKRLMEIERDYNLEDELMMIRLIRARDFLWT